jgi:hypothetical protein
VDDDVEMRPIAEVADELPEELRDIGLDGLLEEEEVP